MSKKTELIISITTGLLLLYTAMGSLSVAFFIIFSLFLILSVLIIVMAMTILKDTSNMSGKKFDNYYYEDSQVKRTSEDS